MSFSDGTLPKLFKRDSKGKIREWEMEVMNDTYRVTAGLIDGKHVTSSWKTAKPKNTGKANATTAEEQALVEATAKWKDQQTKAYFDDINEIDNVEDMPFKPMLAVTYSKLKKPVEFPVYSQPKLDGVRCIANKDGLWTRSGKQITTCEHIWNVLKPLFEEMDLLVLDGELYNHDFNDDFNQIISLVRRETVTDEERIMREKYVQYHIYDIPSVDYRPFGARSRTITHLSEEHMRPLSNSPLKIVPTLVIENQDALDAAYAKYIEDGYEGQMVRLDEPYENKRSKTLIKRKEFVDMEFPIMDIKEGKGNWEGYAKTISFGLTKEFQDEFNYVAKSAADLFCDAGVKGNQEFTKQLLLDKDKYSSGTVTVRFFAPPSGYKPRFPVAVAFYEGKRTT